MSRIFKGGMFWGMAAATLVLAGCDGGGSGGSQPSFSVGSTNGLAVVYGKIVDKSTRKPITGAKVTLEIGHSPLEAASAVDNEKTTDRNEAGDFEFQGVATGSHIFRVEATGYATYESRLSIDDIEGGPAYVPVGDKGTVRLSLGCDVDVYVASEGVLLPGVYVYASPRRYSYNDGTYEIEGVTDSLGRVVLKGLVQEGSYDFVAPAADTDGDGRYDYATSVLSGLGTPSSCLNSDQQMTLTMTKAGRDDDIQVVSTSSDRYKNRTRWGGSLAKNDPIVLVFNYPISFADGEAALTYVNGLVPWNDPLLNKTLSVPVSAALSAGNTVLTITPQEELKVNMVYTLEGAVSAIINQAVSYSSLDRSYYIFDSTGLTGESAVAADNFNGTTDGKGAVGQVVLKFPEFVTGSGLLRSYTMGGKTVDVGESFSLAGENDLRTDDRGTASTLDDGCSGGTCSTGRIAFTSGVRFGLLPAMPDNTAAAPSTISVFIDATDVEGNRLQKEFVLPVE